MNKSTKISVSHIYRFYKNEAKGNFTFLVITNEPIKMQKCSAPQNDRLNLFFIKGRSSKNG